MSYASSFIPSFHRYPSSYKMTSAWWEEAMPMCWHHGNCKGLLDYKNIKDIEGYAVGNYSMKKYRMMFKSQQKVINELNKNGDYLLNYPDMPVDGFVQTPLINVKLNSARALVGKIPLDVEVKAQDSLAIRKKEEDIQFILKKPKLEAELNDIAEQMGIDKVDLGTTEHSAERYSDSPYGLDLNEPDELTVFDGLLYNLGVEAGLQSALDGFAEIKNLKQIEHLEIKDQFYYGVSSHFAFESAITGLPDVEYCYPGDVRVPYSNLPDYSDNAYRFYEKRVTILELLNYSNDICEEDLYGIINDSGTGYCDCNKITTAIPQDEFGWRKADLVLCMIKSVDFVGVAPLNKKSKFTYIVTDPEEAEKCTTKIYGQNTYYAWWLKNTKYYFGIDKLGFAHREQGQESYQSFPINIYKSQDKSAVELSIGENEKAQIADIKMQHAIIMSLPAGRYIDVRFIRNYLAGTKEGITEESMMRVLNLALEKNIVLGDTEGFDGKNDGQFKAVMDLPGGLKTELLGYMQVIADANAKISMYTGINENLIGQKTEELVRNNQAAINAGLTALQYVQDAIAAQYQKLFSNWANVIRGCIERGGKSKEAIVNLIGSKQVNLIDALEDLPLHTMGIKVSLVQDQNWEARFNAELNKNSIQGVIDTIDVYMLEGVTSPKQRFGLLAVKIKQWKKREERRRQEDFANQQKMLQQQGENVQAAVQAKGAMEVEKIYKQGEVNAHILQLASQLGLQASQLNFLGKKALQQDRGNDQLDKSIKTLETKQTLKNQEAFNA